MCVQCQKKALDHLELEMVLATTWVLAIEPWGSARATSAVTFWAISPALFEGWWCSKSPLNPFRDEDTQTLTWKLACHIQFLRQPVLREQAFRLAPDHFLQVLCSRVLYIYQCGLTFLFWEATRDNNNSQFCLWSLLASLGQQLKGKFCMPGVCIFVI